MLPKLKMEQPHPGPWLQHPDYPKCLTTVADPTVSILTVDEDGYGSFLNADDCRLAAAAPELATALQELLSWIGTPGSNACEQELAIARAALAKAGL
jgi:hypothetical protein